MGSASISVDEFQALEQKVLQTVELIKREREAKAAAEAAAKAAADNAALAPVAVPSIDVPTETQAAVSQAPDAGSAVGPAPVSNVN